MLTTFSSNQISSLNRISRPFSTVYTGGFGQLMQDMLTELSSGTIGCTSEGYDIDSLCLGGGAFSYDPVASALVGGLSFVYYAGTVRAGGAVTTTAGATLTLTGSATNYIEVDSAGTVHVNTAGFTAGRYGLYTVVTGSASITSVTSAKTLISWTPPGSITGALLSAAAATRSADVKVGTLTATATYLTFAPCTGTLTAASLVSPLAVASSDTNYWTMSVTNLGAAGSGMEALLAATAANTTKATGGNALAVNVPQALALGATLAVNDGDVLAVTFTASGAPSPLTGAAARFKFTFTG
jgi:hypothetical protein